MAERSNSSLFLRRKGLRTPKEENSGKGKVGGAKGAYDTKIVDDPGSFLSFPKERSDNSKEKEFTASRKYYHEAGLGIQIPAGAKIKSAV